MTEVDDRPVAFAIVRRIDGAAHVCQLSVHPLAARQGRGRRLLDAIADWARSADLDALTLTTFADVPWNAPYYSRLGFRVVAPQEQSAAMRAMRQAEAERGLDQWSRVVMRRDIPAGTVGRRPF